MTEQTGHLLRCLTSIDGPMHMPTPKFLGVPSFEDAEGTLAESVREAVSRADVMVCTIKNLLLLVDITCSELA